jgi:UDP-galactopyranose mutase
MYFSFLNLNTFNAKSTSVEKPYGRTRFTDKSSRKVASFTLWTLFSMYQCRLMHVANCLAWRVPFEMDLFRNLQNQNFGKETRSTEAERT